MADDLKSLSNRIQQLEKDLKAAQLALGQKIDLTQKRAELVALQITDLQKRGVDAVKSIEALEKRVSTLESK